MKKFPLLTRRDRSTSLRLRCSCAICLDDLFEQCGNNDPIYATTCGHIFHYQCITQWINSASASNTCPQCRTKITVESLIKLNIPVQVENRVTRLSNDTLRQEIATLKSELAKVQKELQNERERNRVIRSDLRIMDIIDLDTYKLTP